MGWHDQAVSQMSDRPVQAELAQHALHSSLSRDLACQVSRCTRSVASDEGRGPASPCRGKSCCIQASQEDCVCIRCFSECQVCRKAQAAVDCDDRGCEGDVGLPNPTEACRQAFLVHLPPTARLSFARLLRLTTHRNSPTCRKAEMTGSRGSWRGRDYSRKGHLSQGQTSTASSRSASPTLLSTPDPEKVRWYGRPAGQSRQELSLHHGATFAGSEAAPLTQMAVLLHGSCPRSPRALRRALVSRAINTCNIGHYEGKVLGEWDPTTISLRFINTHTVRLSSYKQLTSSTTSLKRFIFAGGIAHAWLPSHGYAILTHPTPPLSS